MARTSPGEVSGTLLLPLLVTAKTADSLTIQYDVPCDATNHRIHFGALDQISTYAYSGTECGLLDSGVYIWTLPPGLDSLFFVLAADNGAVERSYGVDAGGAERPPNSVDSACPLPRDLLDRCD